MFRKPEHFAPILLCAALYSAHVHAGFNLDMLKQLGIGSQEATQEQRTEANPVSAKLSQQEMDQALKQALSKGVQHAVEMLGKNGGYLDDPSVKIPMPRNLAKVESVLRSLGQEKLADEFVATMNHAAEKAVPEAATVFSNSLKQMTLQDVEGILKGPDDAATQYFRKTSSAQLKERFLPIVEAATNQAGVTAAYKRMMAKAGPLAQFMGGAQDIDGYVTDKALDGLFLKIAEEEKAIRTNPVARSTDLLKKVFGSFSK